MASNEVPLTRRMAAYLREQADNARDSHRRTALLRAAASLRAHRGAPPASEAELRGVKFIGTVIARDLADRFLRAPATAAATAAAAATAPAHSALLDARMPVAARTRLWLEQCGMERYWPALERHGFADSLHAVAGAPVGRPWSAQRTHSIAFNCNHTAALSPFPLSTVSTRSQCHPSLFQLCPPGRNALPSFNCVHPSLSSHPPPPPSTRPQD